MLKRATGAVLAACALILAGCSTTEEPQTETTAVETTTAEESFAAVGDTITAGCLSGDCLGELTVEKLIVGGECDIIDPFLGMPPIPEGNELVQLYGVQEATVEKIDPRDNKPMPMLLGWPNVYDADNFKNTAGVYVGCVAPDGYEDPSTGSHIGEKMRIYHTFLVPENAEVLELEGSRFDLRKLRAEQATATSKTTSQASPSPSQQPEEAGGGGAAPAAPPVTMETEMLPLDQFPDYNDEELLDYPEPRVDERSLESMISYCDPAAENTVFTDGSTGFTAECAVALNAGEGY